MGAVMFRDARLVALALLVILAGGLSALLSIGRQEDPTITNLFATITTPFPGAEPGRVEALVTAEIEEALREVAEVDVVTSTSATGISIVQVELIETLEAEEIETIWSELRDKLADAELAFPQGVGSPDLATDGAGAFGAIVAISGVSSRVPMTLLARYGDALADQLRNVPGTRLVDVYGAPDEEISVTLQTGRTTALGLGAGEIARAIASADTKVRAGRVSGAGNDLVVEVEGEIQSLDRLRNVVLWEGDGGGTVWVGDVAEVVRGPGAPLAEAAYHDGAPALLVAARPEDGLQVDVWAGYVRDEIAAL